MDEIGEERRWWDHSNINNVVHRIKGVLSNNQTNKPTNQTTLFYLLLIVSINWEKILTIENGHSLFKWSCKRDHLSFHLHPRELWSQRVTNLPNMFLKASFGSRSCISSNAFLSIGQVGLLVTIIIIIPERMEINHDTYNWEKIQQWTFGWCELQTITFPRIPKYSSHKIRVHREYLEDKLIHHGKRNITVHRPLHQERDQLVFHADYSCYYYCCCSCSLWFDSFFSSVSVWFEKYKEKREC